MEGLRRRRTIPRLSVAERILRTFSPGERFLLYLFTAILTLSTLVLFTSVNSAASVVVPVPGGSLVEGVVGPARFINPILALSQADEDLTELVYSGLTRTRPDGTIIPDLAEKFEISEDGTTYTFTLRDNATFHDGEKVSAVDILYTVQSAQNPDIKSPRRADWEGVSVSTPDERTVVFKLPHAYAPFLENTSLGVLPRHIWEDVSPAEFPFNPANTRPVGSGPYRVHDVKTNSTGAATQYELRPFKEFALGEPYLRNITFVFYPNFTALIEALNKGDVESVAAVPASELASVTGHVDILRVPLPRVFGVFFNQNHSSVFTDASVRAALEASIDTRALIRDVLGGNGVALTGPIPRGVLEPIEMRPALPTIEETITTLPSEARVEEARGILTRGGWKFDETTGAWTKKKEILSFSLATADAPELAQTAEILKDTWGALGITVNVETYPLAELNTNVIRPRSYDAILFGEVVGRTLDLFAFWHSSQRNDPGLNLALYTNSKADSLLATARATTDNHERENLYRKFEDIVVKDRPAIFLYAPEFLYALPRSLHGVELGALTTPSERFANVYEWYTETENVWSIFTNRGE